MKILVIRFSSIGDIVLTTPVLRCLKKTHPDSIIHFLTKSNYVPLLEANPYIDRIIGFQGRIKPIRKMVHQEGYSHVIDLHNNLRSTLITLGMSGKKSAFYKANVEKWLKVNLKVDVLPKKHIVDRYLKTVASLNVRYDGMGLDYFLPQEDEVSLESLPKVHWEGFIAFAIGGKFETKKLPPDKILSICARIEPPVVLLGGPEDAATGDLVSHSLGERIYSAAGRYSINQSASIIRQATAVITHDTGMMHIAAAFNKKIISVWGSTIPAFGMSPFMADSHEAQQHIVQVDGLGCRPCSKIGFQSCPRGHFKCMREIDDSNIIDLL